MVHGVLGYLDFPLKDSRNGLFKTDNKTNVNKDLSGKHRGRFARNFMKFLLRLHFSV